MKKGAGTTSNFWRHHGKWWMFW